jgi:hypothetical protein
MTTIAYTPDAKNYSGDHHLTGEERTALIAHFHQCEMPFLTCAQCAELYQDIGYKEYEQLTLQHPEDMEYL